MKSLSSILICFLFVLICTSCERYESLDVEYNDVYGTWKLVEYLGAGEFAYMVPGIDHLTIVRSDEKKVIGKDKPMSKFADYQSHLKGELVASGEVFIIKQYDDAVWISFTNNGFYGSNQIAITSLNANEMFLNMYPTAYNYPTYSFIKVSNPIE